ncbi:hypothetical protein HDU84_005294 [Entophlyctis sp. JEL0112]|nr:hypothetical protein HDU84_005294 [Entophlyctis sp. JEL0112]
MVFGAAVRRLAPGTLLRASREKVRTLLSEHGPAALLTYSAVSVSSFALWCTIAHFNDIDMGTLGRLLLPAIPSSAAAAAITTSVDDALQDVAREVKQVAHGVEERFELAEVKMRETAGTAVAALMDRVDSVRIAGAAIGDGADAAVANVSSFSKRTTVLAVAWCIHNISFPARVGITAVLAPYVGARLRGGRIEKMMKKGFEVVGRSKDKWASSGAVMTAKSAVRERLSRINRKL